MTTPNPTVTPKVLVSSTPSISHIPKVANTQGNEDKKKFSIREKENHPNPTVMPSITPSMKKSTPYIYATPISTITPKVSVSNTPFISNPNTVHSFHFAPPVEPTKSKEVKGYTELKKSEELLVSENRRISTQLRGLELERDMAIQQLLSLQKEIALLKDTNSRIQKEQEEERNQFQQQIMEQEQESIGKTQRELQDLRDEMNGYKFRTTALERRLEDCGVDVVSLQRTMVADSQKQEEIKSRFNSNLSEIHEITQNIEDRLNKNNLIQEKWDELENNFALWEKNYDSLLGEVLEDFENGKSEPQSFDELLLLQEM